MGYAESREPDPWVPLDGSEVRTVISRWPAQDAPVSIPTAGVVRLDISRIRDLPPIVGADSLFVVSGVDLLDGSDPLATPLPILAIRAGSIDVEGDAALTGDPGAFQRATDRLPNFGGWLINPRDRFELGTAAVRTVEMSGVDYSAVMDRRLNYGPHLVTEEGETVGQAMARMLHKWQHEIPGIGGEDLADEIDRELGGVIDPPFDDRKAGGVRLSWRAAMDALQARAQGEGAWDITPDRAFRWRATGRYTGLTLLDSDYTQLDITQDRQRSRNVVDVREDLQDSILVEDITAIAERARIEGGTGRYELVAESLEGTAPGTEVANLHGIDQLARYPFLFTLNIGSREAVENRTDTLMTHAQRIALLRLQPGDLILVGGQHLPHAPAGDRHDDRRADALRRAHLRLRRYSGRRVRRQVRPFRRRDALAG